jgi:hypothetical protein
VVDRVALRDHFGPSSCDGFGHERSPEPFTKKPLASTIRARTSFVHGSRTETNEGNMQERIDKLEAELRRVKTCSALLTVALLGLLPLFCGQHHDGILRARGLIIEDEQGRERILLGAPIPPAAHRVRTDLERVKEVWAPIMGEGFLKYYENYRHDMNGLLILDEKGFDKLALGDPTHVTRFKPGDDVFGGRTGAFGEYVCVREDGSVARKPL